MQGQRSLDRAQGGLGVGLALVKGLVELHGGNVEGFSDGPGLGAEFVVHLPRIALVAPATAPRDEAPAPHNHSRRVLVVDDNEDAAEMTAEIIRARGHEVITACDGEKAVAAVSGFGRRWCCSISGCR